MTEAGALTALVEAEQAAVYGYGLLGARLSAAALQAARLAYDGHRARRDDLAAALRARGLPVPVPPASYDVAVGDPAQALALAVRLEVGLAQRWRDLVLGTDDRALRQLAVAALTESAVRAAEWRARQGVVPPTVPLPGT